MLVAHEEDIFTVRQRARCVAGQLGFGAPDQTRIATAVSEIARNAHDYAGGGRVEFGVDVEGNRQLLLVRIGDKGPGITELPAILEGRYRSSTGLGIGITGSRRLMDRFEVATNPATGTSVVLGKVIPDGRPPLDGPSIVGLAEAMRSWRDGPQTAMREQNRELLASLAELTEREEEARRLNAELAETNRGVVALYAELETQAGQLREAGANLETLVTSRTAELARANKLLKSEAAERERMGEALRQSQKMEAVGQLTGGLAHDFNNLLAGISGSLELMQTRMQQGRLTDVDRYMTAAQGATRRAAALTHRLLAFSRRQTLDPKPTDVNRLTVGMQELIQRTVGPTIPIEVVGASGIWPALVDPSQLENALLNLCINARDAMPDGGRITIETANRWLDEWAAKKHDIPEGQYLSLCVTDTGTGMPPEVVARVFEPFFTTKPIGEGTGLGLSMIYGFAQQSGGQVRIYSEVGQGTTVCIYLPRHYGEVADDATDAAATVLPRSDHGETVLVVDDEPTVRMLVTDILEDLGYTSIEAGDSAAGLKILQSDVRIDLLVTDVGLPGGMNGRQMADAARTHRPDLKVLFITGYAENAILGNGKLSPGMAVLTKPFAIENMAARIRSMIEVGPQYRV
nr:ATP-binding protein [Methylobacterium sp. GC_Met_2]